MATKPKICANCGITPAPDDREYIQPWLVEYSMPAYANHMVCQLCYQWFIKQWVHQRDARMYGTPVEQQPA